ncbi:alanine racemase [Angulomicrobium tetraedrale]|uniref:Alanine racemase n=1 Tax=Ancylobacter tetraedralis TaxID=217068 RepID=A0A839Z3P6_9HYPH|nr:alanine racemase [Ancylobacter tetraedralis]MBB3770262.1 alanine racemase [Ancylobacter tetraedralis]
MVMDASVPPDEAGGLLTIDLAALRANYQEIARRVGPAETAGVVKGDGYGLGLAPVASALWDAGARSFFVALPGEARTLRETLPEATIYVLNGLFEGSPPLYRALRLHPVLGSEAEIARWNGFCVEIGQSLPAAVHVDTGMNRLGLSATEAVSLAEMRHELHFPIALIMSHLASADEPHHPLTARQLEDFRAIAGLFPDVKASLANSAGVMSGPAYHFDLVRPGIAVYGGRPRADMAPLSPVVRLELRIVQIRHVHAGETVGYGGAHTALRPSRVAILSAGYADGIPRRAGASDLRPGAEAVIAGQRCPLIGRISMDLLAVDVTDVPDDAIAAGDWAVLLGDGLGLDDLARHSQTIDYEILTSLGRRYRRLWT